MIEQISGFVSAISERETQAKIKLALSVLFTGSLASWFFERFYFKYELIDLTDYNAYYNFLIRGHFIVPLSLFFLTWISTYLLSLIFFVVPNVFLANKIRKSIDSKFSFADISSFKIRDDFQRGIEILSNKSSKNGMLDVFSNIIKKIKNIKQVTTVGMVRVKNEFTFLMRAGLAIIFYYNTSNHFDLLLLSILIIVMVVWLLLLTFTYQLIELIEAFLHKDG